MTTLSKIKQRVKGKVAAKPRIGDSDGITDKVISLTALALMTVSLVLAFASFSVAQHHQELDPVIIELTDAAMLDMHHGQYHAAKEKLVKVQAEAPMASIDHLLGVCYHYIGNYVAAKIHLEAAQKHLQQGGEAWSPLSGFAPIHTLNYLGKVCYDRGDYEAAQHFFAEFLEGLYMLEDSDSWIMDWTQEMIADCESLEPLA